MSETQKSPEKKQETPQSNGVELPHVQEARQLGVVRQRMREVVQRQRNSEGTTQERQDVSSRFDLHGQSFDLGPGSWPTSVEVSQENFVESAEVKDEREVQNARNRYQEQLKTTYDSHFQYLRGKPEEQKRLGVTYIEGSMRDLEISTDNPGEDDVRIIAETFPDAWRATLLDPKTAENNPELQKMRDTILDRVSDGAASIDPEDFIGRPEEYKKALLDDIQSVTGLNISPEELQKLLGNYNNLDDDLKKVLAPLAAISGDPKAQQDIDSNNFYQEPSEADLKQNPDEIIGDHPDFSELKSIYDGIAEPDSRISQFHSAAGLQAGPGTPWCMSFVQYVLRKHYGYQGPQTAAARDGLKIGKSTPHPGPGDLVLLPRNGGSGYHVAFVEKMLGNKITYWGGNQSNRVCSKTTEINSGMQFRQITGLNDTGGGH